MITVTLYWYYIFPAIATFLYLKECIKETKGHYMDILAYGYFGVPYLIFWLIYLLILKW